jgi:hypothetical protein
MRSQRMLAFLVIAALLLAGYLLVSSDAKGAEEPTTAPPEVAKLLASSETTALELKLDAMRMEALTQSHAEWRSQTGQIAQVMEHVSSASKLLADMQANREAATPWQGQTIDEIAPLLRELAANLAATVARLGDNPSLIHEAKFRDYTVANDRTADKLAGLIEDYIDYAEARQRLQLLTENLNPTEDQLLQH